MNSQEIEALLDRIPDPEIPVISIRELGILRGIRLASDEVEITITPTYSGCPAMDQIEDDIRAALSAHPLRVRIMRQLAPPWTTDAISPEGREKLRRYGIAPPHGTDAATVRFASSRRTGQEQAVPCPRCNSANTTETSHFGSTACKALYRCLDCMEPFDYFKPY